METDIIFEKKNTYLFVEVHNKWTVSNAKRVIDETSRGRKTQGVAYSDRPVEVVRSRVGFVSALSRGNISPRY
jgi:hypothetical protein